MTKIYQYRHYPNATELGQGNTHETYLMIEKKFDLSKLFPIGQSVYVTDISSGKQYDLRSTLGAEFRVNQFGPIYRDYDTYEGDEIWLTGIEIDDKMQVYLRVEKKNRITLSFTSQGAFFNNDNRISAFGSKQSGYTIPVTYDGNMGHLTIKFIGAKKKRTDSPDYTDFYEVEFANTPIKSGNFILDLDSKEFYSYQKASLNIVTLSGEKVPDSTDNSLYNKVVFESIVDECQALLLENHNLILTGAPGTGKTFLAKQIAAKLVAGLEWKELNAEQQKHVRFVQFHPSYDYTDFVEGIKPIKGGNFERQDGEFKDFCKQALRVSKDPIKALSILKGDLKKKQSLQIPYYDTDGYFTIELGDKDNIIVHPKSDNSNQQAATDEKILQNLEQNERVDKNSYTYYISVYLRENYMTGDFVFIIDEINRGELSKIFGELFYSIEPNYRGPEGRVKTQYNSMVEEDDVFKEGFYVPDNIYIIGTMNDVDRSVESMDFAIRRRFAWREVTAEESAINMGIKGLALVKMRALNSAILKEDRSDAYCIGGAYFRNVVDDFDALWKLHLKGVISEYFRGEPDASQKIKRVEAKYYEAQLVSSPAESQEEQTTDSSTETDSE